MIPLRSTPSTATPRPDAARRVVVAVGVMVYNEGHNLGALLGRLRASTGSGFELRQITVVSSGSTDQSENIARQHKQADQRVRLINDPERRGKATAINQFLSTLDPAVEVCVLLGGDVLPATETIGHLVGKFEDPSVGMAGAHPMPQPGGDGLVSRIVNLQWELHDLVSRRKPKMGEMIAFRADVPHLDPSTAVDEAWLESVVIGRGQRLAYADQGVVYNHGPRTLRELVNQRRRIFAGHFVLNRDTGYRVSTLRLRDVLGVTARHLMANPATVPTAAAAVVIELGARALGVFDVVVRKSNPTVWKRIDSSKQPFDQDLK